MHFWHLSYSSLIMTVIHMACLDFSNPTEQSYVMAVKKWNVCLWCMQTETETTRASVSDQLVLHSHHSGAVNMRLFSLNFFLLVWTQNENRWVLQAVWCVNCVWVKDQLACDVTCFSPSLAQIPLGSTRLDTFDVSSPCILAVSS